MAKTEIARFGNLNDNYGYLTDVYGLAIGRYETGRPNMVYDSVTGKMSFKVYETEYMALEYNAGNPRVYLGNSINSIELVTSGLSVGNTGKVSGGNVVYGEGDGFWFGYHDSAYKAYIGNGSNSLIYDGTNLTLTGAFAGTKSGFSDDTAGFWLGPDSGTYKLYIGSATEHIKWDGSNLTITGGLTVDSVNVGITGAVYGGQTDYDTGVGFWLGYKDGTHKLSFGSSTGKKLLWDGTDLTWTTGKTSAAVDGTFNAVDAVISGTITANTGHIGGPTGWVIEEGKITSTGIGMATAVGDETYAFWAGDNTPVNAEFSVTHAGVLKAISAVVSGTIFANTGYFGEGGNIVTVDANGLAIGESGSIRGVKANFADDTAGFFMGAESGVYKFKIGDDTKNISWDGSDLTINASVTVNSLDVIGGGYVRGGQTAYDTGVGFWLGDDSGTYKFSVGDSSTNKKFRWDGENLMVGFGKTGVGSDGILHANDAIISGTITANVGHIGGPTGWVIAEGKLTSTGIGLATAAGDATYAFWAGDNTPASAEFAVKHDGTFKSTAGTVGGWTIGADSLTAGTTTNGTGMSIAGGATPAFWAGNTTPASAAFRVYQNGNLNASAATISGAITATSGVIGGWSINDQTLVSDGLNITLDAGNNLIYVGDIHLHGDLAEIHSNDYHSGISGFKLSADYLEVNNINARGMIRTAVFQKDMISVVGGTVMVLPGDILAEDMTADGTTLVASGTHTFELNDVIRIKDGTDDEWLYITNVSSAPTYTVQRDLAGVYGPNVNPTWKKGSSIVSYQGWSEGGIKLTSTETNAPYLSVFVRPADTTYPYSNGGLIEKARLGNLTGIADTTGYGLWTDNGYFTGTVNAQAGYFGDGVNRVSIEDGGLIIGNTGSIRGGATDFSTDTGLWMGYDSGAYKLRVGNPSGAYLSWDGTNLIAIGSIKTGTTGQRVEINKATNDLLFYNASGTSILTLADWSSSAYWGGPGIIFDTQGWIQWADETQFPAYINKNGILFKNASETSYYQCSPEFVRISSSLNSDIHYIEMSSIPNNRILFYNYSTTYDAPYAFQYYIESNQNSLILSSNICVSGTDVHDVVKIYASAGYRAYSIYDIGGVNPKFYNVGNALWFGPGTAGVDTGFYRSNTGQFTINGISGGTASLLVTGGIYIGSAANTNTLIDDASHGSGSTTLYIGNKTIDTTASDGRYKNILGVTTRGLNTLNKLQVLDYMWKESFDSLDKKKHIGLIAQDAYSVDEALGRKPMNEDTGLWTVSNDDLLALCVKSIQELNDRVTKLEKENKDLKKQVANLSMFK